jgi:hypothetical protein
MLANIANPPNTAPVAPRPASATGRAQQDDAASAPSPATAPSPANQLPEGAGRLSRGCGAGLAGAATDGVSIMVMPLCIP